jgi:hypothetical protein
MKGKQILQVENKLVSVCTIHNQDYICLTDMIRHLPNNHVIISNWLRKKDTIEYLGIWEGLYNPDFKLIEFDEFKSEAGTNRFSKKD